MLRLWNQRRFGFFNGRFWYSAVAEKSAQQSNLMIKTGSELFPVKVRPMNPFLKPLTGFIRAFGGAFHPLRPISLPSELFAAPRRPDLIHRVVQWYLAGERKGLASSKGRGEVRGSNRKIHPQKGTGAARAGDARAPHRRGGGACFGPKPRDFSFDLPRKLRWLAFRSALTEKYQSGLLNIIDENSLNLPLGKTSELSAMLEGFKRPDRRRNSKGLLIVGTESIDSPNLANLLLAGRSLDGATVTYIDVTGAIGDRGHQKDPVCAYHLMKFNRVCLTPAALDYYTKMHQRISNE